MTLFACGQAPQPQWSGKSRNQRSMGQATDATRGLPGAFTGLSNVRASFTFRVPSPTARVGAARQGMLRDEGEVTTHAPHRRRTRSRPLPVHPLRPGRPPGRCGRPVAAVPRMPSHGVCQRQRRRPAARARIGAPADRRLNTAEFNVRPRARARGLRRHPSGPVSGAGDGNRTRGLHLGRVTLYH